MNWIIRDSAADYGFTSLAYGDDKFVALSYGDGDKAMVSPDGINWSVYNTFANNKYVKSIAFGNGVFVAVCVYAQGSEIRTSPNGINWTDRTPPESFGSWNSVIFDGTQFVAVQGSGSNQIGTSPDGITWTSRVSPVYGNWQSVAHGNGTYVVVGYTENCIKSTNNAVTWSTVNMGFGTGVSNSSIAYGNGTFVVVGYSGSSDPVLTSPDGTTWTSRTPAISGVDWKSIIYGGDQFVAVGENLSGNSIMTSPDGITWTEQETPANNDWEEVVYQDGLYVAVASTGTGNRAMTDGQFTVRITDPTSIRTVSGASVELTGEYFSNSTTLYLSGAENGIVDYTSAVDVNTNSYVKFTVPEITPSTEGYYVYVNNPAYGNSNLVSMMVLQPLQAFNEPGIKFLSPNPDNRLITSGVTDSTGRVHVQVFDNREYSSITALSANFILTDDSIGEIDYTSLSQVTSSTVEFDVINISAYGNVIVSAQDDYGTSALGTDGPWYYTCVDGKLINLVDFLPQHLFGSDIYDFTKFFEDYLNTMYEDSDDVCNDSILRKVEKIRDFNDPTAIDLDYISHFASKLGYDVGVSRSELGLFVTSGSTNYEDLTGTELENANKYLRLVVQNLPNWYKIKTTRNSIKVMLLSFGLIGELQTLFTNDYDSNWIPEFEGDNISVNYEVPEDYYPSSHYLVSVDLKQNSPKWADNIQQVINAVDSIRPINTVFRGMGGYYVLTPEEVSVRVGDVNSSVHMYLPWSGAPAEL